jgi:hypothetical protein
LAEFARSKVSYALLGGYAVGYHAKPRATKDLDLLLSGLGDNLERAASALAAFGAPAQVVESVRSLRITEIAYLGAPPVRVDPAGRRERRSANRRKFSAFLPRLGNGHLPTR